MLRAWRSAAMALVIAIISTCADAKPRKQRARPMPRWHISDWTLCKMLTPEARDLVVRTVMGEANREPYLGKVGVAAVIRNRLLDGGYGGNSVEGVLFKPKQFEPWSTRRAELMSYGPETPGWREAEQAVDEAFAGNDPTRGATHFANVGTVAARGNRSALSWLRGMANVSKVGAHTFGNADGKGAGRDTDTSSHALMARLGFDEDLQRLDDDADGFGSMIARLQEPTDDPRRMAVRTLIFEILDGLQPSDDGQGHAVAPSDAGAAFEDAEA